MPKKTATRDRTAFGARMFAARERAGLKQKQVQALAGIGQSSLSELETTGQSSGKITTFAALYGVPAHWLATGEGPSPFWAGGALLAGEPPKESPQAQDVSHVIGSDAPLLMSWEDIVRGEVREEFKLVVRDEAMAPDYMPGLEIVWSTRRLPKPGRLVLVRDKHGQVHIRQHMQGREPGQWLAAPSNGAYATFDSVADGLVVLAVFKGRLEPDDA